jgi:ABC-type nitrate/sulfonate/bicarbonate transport system substrate-binding protein
MTLACHRWLLGILAGLFVLPTTPAAGANINVVWTSEVGQFAPLWITKEAHLFEKYGNQVQLIFIQGAASAAAALSSGDAQVGMFSPQVVIATPGLELVMFGRLGNTMDNRIYARKGIKSLKEVKRIAISRFGSNADFAARYLLQREGLKPVLARGRELRRRLQAGPPPRSLAPRK